jgi:hypothetical protein
MKLYTKVSVYAAVNCYLFLFTRANDLYGIEPCPSGTSTVHVKSFSSSISSVNFIEKFINSNREKAILTLWPSPHNESLIPRPLPSFNERCTINVVVEMPSPNLEDSNSIASYIRNTNFPFRNGYSHSIFIQIKFDCFWQGGHQSLTLPISLFLYFVDCKFVDDLRRKFPHVYVSPYCAFGFRLNNSLSIYGAETRVKYRAECSEGNLGLTTRPPILVEKINWPTKSDCLQTRWNADEYGVVGGDLGHCQTTDFLMIHVVHDLRFQYVYDQDIQYKQMYPPLENTRGWVFLNKFFGGNLKNDLNYIFYDHYTGRSYIKVSRSHFIYCEFDIPREQDMSFLAWLSPFRMQVWFVFAATIFGTSVCLSMQDIIVAGCQGSKSFLESATKMGAGLFTIVGIVLRQDPDNMSTVLRTTFAFAIMVYTSVYENTVTSELIVPVLPNIMENAKQLFENGYLIFKYGSLIERPETGPAFLSSHSMGEVDSELGFLPSEYIVYPTSQFGSQDYQRVYNNRERKLAEHFPGTEYEAQWTLYDIGMYSKYPCHRTSEPEGFYLDYMQVIGFFEKEATRLVSLYKEAGLFSFWDSLQEFLSYLVFLRSSVFQEKFVNKNQSNILTLYNLIPVFCVWIGLCVASVVGFLGEVCTSGRIAIKCNFIIKVTPKATAPRQVNQQILVRTCTESD